MRLYLLRFSTDYAQGSQQSMKKTHFDDITETAKRYVPKIRTKSAEIITILLRSDLSSHAMRREKPGCIWQVD